MVLFEESQFPQLLIKQYPFDLIQLSLRNLLFNKQKISTSRKTEYNHSLNKVVIDSLNQTLGVSIAYQGVQQRYIDSLLKALCGIHYLNTFVCSRHRAAN